MSESDIRYIPVDTSKKGGETRALKAIRREHIVPVIPPDPEDENFDSTSVPDDFGTDVHDEEKRIKPDMRKTVVVSAKGTHASHSSQKYE